jgi:hypothetical protein
MAGSVIFVDSPMETLLNITPFTTLE